MTVPIQRACPTCESTVRAGGCGDRWHGETYLVDLRDHAHFVATKARYINDHTDYDHARHTVYLRIVSRGVWEIAGHRDRDFELERRMSMCCCHPDKPRGHDR